MNVRDAQRDVRTTFLGGFAGQLVSSLIWFLSATLGTWVSTRSAIVVLVAGRHLCLPAHSAGVCIRRATDCPAGGEVGRAAGRGGRGARPEVSALINTAILVVESPLGWASGARPALSGLRQSRW
jgi:hypothetical protein